MNSEVEKKPSSPSDKDSWKGKLIQWIKSLPKQLWHVLIHNWPWKLLSVFLALCLWAGLITQDPTLTREKVFTDVPIAVSGAEALKRNGLIVLSDLSTEALQARLRVDVPQMVYDTVTSTNYNPRVDLTKITETGTQTLRIQTTSTSSYGSVKEVSPDTIEVEVDSYTSRYRIPVSVEVTGEFPAGFYGTQQTLDPAVVTVSGPRSLLSEISRATATFDLCALPAQAGLIRTAVPIVLVGTDGQPIDDSLIQITSEGVLLSSVIIEQKLYPTKTMQLSNLSLVSGKPKEGYEVKNVFVTPSILFAAGDESALGTLDTLFTDMMVDVQGKSESFTTEVKVRKPSELVYISPDTVTVAVEIGLSVSSKTFTGVKLAFRDSSGLRAVKTDTKTVSVTLTGPTLSLNAVKIKQLEPYIDVSELDEGTHTRPIFLSLDTDVEAGFTYTIKPENAQFDVSIKQ